jgi:hypothetical protein
MFLKYDLDKKYWDLTKQGGLDLSRRGLDRDSWSRHQKRVSLDGRENLDSFKKLVSTIEMSLAKTVLFGQKRFFETCRDFCDFSGFLDIFLDLDQDITWILIYLYRDIYFSCRNLWWVRM